MPITTPPTFNPPAYGIAPGAAGLVLTSNGPTSKPSFQAAGTGGGGFLPGFLSVAPAAGITNNFNPGAPWPAGIGRLDIDTTAGNVELTGLLAGTDGQIVLIRNTGTNNLQLDDDGASSVGNTFNSNGNLIILPNGRTLAVYYAGVVNEWSIG